MDNFPSNLLEKLCKQNTVKSGDTAVAKKIHPLITNPYVNEVTLRRQKPPLKCY